MSSTLTNLIYHVVFSTKGRLNLMEPNSKEDLFAYICGIVKGEGGAVLNIGGTMDHLHILFKSPPRISISELMKKIKGNSSKWMNEKHIGANKFKWQIGYGAFSVSESIVPKVSEYIGNQEEHHRKFTFRQEFLLLLEKHKVKYDEKYIWD